MNKKTRLMFIIGNIIISAIVLLMDVFRCFVFYDLIYKQIATILVCVLAISNFILSVSVYKKKYLLFSLLLFLGIIIGSLADFLIGINFIIGAALFGVGHILYIISFYCISKFKWQEILALCIVIAITMIIIFVPYINYGQYTFVIVTYAVILSAMLAKCLVNYLFNCKKNLLNLFLALAGLLFYVSDLMLLLYVFKGADIICDKLCLMLYYPAQILFSCAILINVLNIKHNNALE